MATVTKDTTLGTPTSITKTRKKLTSYGFDPINTVIYITYDIIAVDSSNNEVYILSTGNVITIPQSRFSETLIAATITATKNMILNEF